MKSDMTLLSSSQSASEAVSLGLLRFPPPSQAFPGRDGKPMLYAVDSRGSVGNVPLREIIIRELLSRISRAGHVDGITGVSKSGVAWAAIAADRLSLPMSVVLLAGRRSSGLQRQIEGDVGGKRVLVVDNFVKTGESLDQAAEILESAGATVAGFLTIVAVARAAMRKPLYTAWTLDELLVAAANQRLVTDSQLRQILTEVK